MTEKTTPAPRRKTQQAMKVSASWTPSAAHAAPMMGEVFGAATPLRAVGGRLTINAAIALDMTDPSQAARVAARVQELRKELEASGTVHSFVVAAGAVPVGEAEVLPEEATDA